MRTRLLTLLTTAAAAGGAAGQGVPFVGVGSNGTVVTGAAAGVPPRPLATLPKPPALGYQAYPGTGRLGLALPPALGGFRDYGYGPGSYVPGR